MYLKYFYLFILVVLFCLFQLIEAQSIPGCELPQFGLITIDPELELNGAGQNIDSIEFWNAPNSNQTLMFVTAKANHLVEVWKYPFSGNEQSSLTHSTFNNGQVNGIAVEQESDILYVSIGSSSSTISVFSLPGLAFQYNFSRSGANYYSEPNLTILKLTNGTKYIYVSKDNSVDIHNAVNGNFIKSFTPSRGLETMAADDYYQRIYIPDENNRSGVYVYTPEGGVYMHNGSSVFGGGGIFNSDAEGIIVYTCPLSNSIDNGNGFIVVSDQRSDKTDFEFFDRVTWVHLGKLNITGVSNTDGIASYPYSLPAYPLGLFAAIDNDATVALVGWDKIFNAINENVPPVPVELVSFSAFNLANSILLNWETETELNNYGFEIQRSSRTEDWKRLGFLEGHGNSNSPKNYRYEDNTLNISSNYSYRLKQIDNDGSYEFSKTIEINFDSPNKIELKQNFPNPFNPVTSIQYSLDSPANGTDKYFVSLKVYNILGNEVAILVNEEKPAGTHNVIFSPKNLTSGTYFYKIKAGDLVQTKKMILLR